MSWTHTSRGRALDLLDPKPGDVDLEEIGRALGHQCRYNGCTTRFYSVAEHSVLVGRWLHGQHPDRPDLWLAGLLHDAAEAYTGDLTFPMQQALWGRDVWNADGVRDRYKRIQRGLDLLICGIVGLNPDVLHAPEVRAADLRILLDERDVLLLGRPGRWDVEDMGPLGVTVEGWSPPVAESEWWRELTEAVDAHTGEDLADLVSP